MKTIIFIFIVFFAHLAGHAQDPHFSQFFSAPMYLNPAQTMNTDADYRLMSNFRSQWINPAAPYITGVLSAETRLLKKTTNDNILGGGISLMHDYTFDGILKSNYASGFMAYHSFMDEEKTKKLSVGFGGTYGKKSLDFSRLVFAEQFTTGGFNTSMPSGETLSNMKSFLSLSSGINYSYSNESINFEIGASGYHLNNPKQTFLNDQYQTIPKRFTGNAMIDFQLKNSDIINFSAVYQHQSNIDYYLIGTNYAFNLSRLGKISSDETVYLNVGAFYRPNDAIIPYISYYINDFQFGFTYDETISKLALTNSKAKTFEMSMSYRFKKAERDGSIKCPYSPWK